MKKLGERIHTIERLVIDASRVTRYLGYPRKVPIWKINFVLPEYCYIYRNSDNSDISLEIENMKGFAVVPALSEVESLKRLTDLMPNFELQEEIERL